MNDEFEEDFEVNWSDSTCDGSQLSKLQYFEHLEVLCLSGCSIHDDALDSIPVLSSCTHLILSNNELRNPWNILQKRFPALTYLNLCGNASLVVPVAHVDFPGFENLSELEVSEDQATNIVCPAMSGSLTWLPVLRYVNGEKISNTLSSDDEDDELEEWQKLDEDLKLNDQEGYVSEESVYTDQEDEIV